MTVWEKLDGIADDGAVFQIAYGKGYRWFVAERDMPGKRRRFRAGEASSALGAAREILRGWDELSQHHKRRWHEYL